MYTATECDAGRKLHEAFLTSEPVLRYIAVRRFRVRPEDLDDLLQDVFLLFMRDLPAIDDPRAWLIGTLSNKCRHYCRIRTRRIEREGTASCETGYEPTIETSLTVRTILRRLSAADRDLLRLRFVEGFRVREIAARLGTTRSTADKRLRAALKRARRAAGSSVAGGVGPARGPASWLVMQTDPFGSLLILANSCGNGRRVQAPATTRCAIRQRIGARWRRHGRAAYSRRRR